MAAQVGLFYAGERCRGRLYVNPFTSRRLALHVFSVVAGGSCVLLNLFFFKFRSKALELFVPYVRSSGLSIQSVAELIRPSPIGRS